MLDYSTIRNYFKATDTISSDHLVVVEWNMNKYKTIEDYGVYKSIPPLTASYSSSDSNIIKGKNNFIYEDNTKKLDPESEYYSTLTSIFEPNRPDPGIILLQSFSNTLITNNADQLKIENITTASPRYYPFSVNRPYDYFNSAKILDFSDNEIYGISNGKTGKIIGASPFAVYDNEFPCNKIVIKVQNHLSVPKEFSIETLDPDTNTWDTAYSTAQSSESDFSTGVLSIYYNNGSWSKNVNRVDDINQLNSVSPTELKNIKGVRLTVHEMSNIPGDVPASLEIIELSPRLEMDLTSYTEDFSFNSSLGDSTSLGLPVGSIVSSTGNVSFSNEGNNFLFSSTLNELKMLNPDTKFIFYQKVTIPNDNTYYVPLKVMYSNNWSVQNDYSVTVNIEDGFKFLREKSAPDLLFQSKIGTRLSVAVLSVLDNIGFTGLQFNTTNSRNSYDREDTVIRNFFCRKEQTVAEVLEQLAIATQCSMAFDAAGNFNIFTKERLTEIVDIDASTNSTPGTDFWMVLDETTTGATADEISNISSYTANVMNYSEEKLNPITDGEVVYHTYGPRKVPGPQTLPEEILNELTQDLPASALAFSNFSYATKILWSPGQDSSAVLGCANLNRNLGNKKLGTVYTSNIVALDEEDAVQQIYNAIWTRPTQEESVELREASFIPLDRNEAFTIPDYEGYLLIDKEYIKYKGKVYSISSPEKDDGTPGFTKRIVIFNDEQLQQQVRNLPIGSSLSILGLMIDVKFRNIGVSENKYIYQIIGDGRGKFSSTIDKHFAVTEESDDITDSNQFKLTLGSRKGNTPGKLTASTKFNFIDSKRYKSAKNSFGSLPKQSLQSYLGFLKLAGPKGPAEDNSLIDQLDGAGSDVQDIAKRLNELNKQVDAAVPGNFDDFVYLQGDRNIYGQKINVGFKPNVISTRMRLFSPRKKLKNNEYIMSTNASIAGIGFGVNSNNEGYFLEVESVGAGRDSVAKEAYRNNLRFYKVSLNKNGKYEPKLLTYAPVNAYTVSNTDVQVVKTDNTADPVFEIEIQIEEYQNGMRYVIFYGNKQVGSYIEPKNEAIGVNRQNVFMFVRNDSQAIFEYIAAAARPKGKINNRYWKSGIALEQKIKSGIIPVDKNYIFKNNEIQFYFNDFARLARQVREYEIRFETPAFTSTLINISKINPQYRIKDESYTAFGARLVVANTSSGPIMLGPDSNLPLYIIGVGLEELGAGSISIEDTYNKIDEEKRRVTEREKNLAVYGSQTFNIDSQFVQNISQAQNMVDWIIRYCGRQRLKMSMEILPNPLIELGDRVRIYDPSRGYFAGNSVFGERTFVVSSISHSISNSGPSMSVDIIEVGES